MAKNDISSKSSSSNTIGSILKKARIKRETSLEDISTSLNIEIENLRQIEEDNFEYFSAPVFSKGYIRSYALELGLEPELLLEKYLEQVGSDKPPNLISANRIPSLLTYPRINLNYAIITTATLLFILLVVYTLPFNQDDHIQSVSSISTPTVEIEGLSSNEFSYNDGLQLETLDSTNESNQDIAQGVEQELTSLVAEDNNTGALDSTNESNQDIAQGVEQELTSLVAEDNNTSALVGELEILESSISTQESNNSIVDIEILYLEDCWVEVYDGNNRRLLYYLGREGEEIRLEAIPPVSFLLGNYEGVKVLIDKITYFIPGDARRGDIAQFSVLNEVKE